MNAVVLLLDSFDLYQEFGVWFSPRYIPDLFSFLEIELYISGKDIF